MTSVVGLTHFNRMRCSVVCVCRGNLCLMLRPIKTQCSSLKGPCSRIGGTTFFISIFLLLKLRYKPANLEFCQSRFAFNLCHQRIALDFYTRLETFNFLTLCLIKIFKQLTASQKTGGNLLKEFYSNPKRFAYTFESYTFVSRMRDVCKHSEKRFYTKNPVQFFERSCYSSR